MTIKSRLEKLEKTNGNGFVVVVADRVDPDGTLHTDRTDLNGRRVVLLAPDAVNL